MSSSITAFDCHIHVQSAKKAEDLLRAMDIANVETSFLMGSSKFTITLRPSDGFTFYHENNLQLLEAKKKHPGRFEVWPTIDPLASDNCSRLKDYIAAGASGLKLYVGHGFSHGSPPQYLFHTTTIDSNKLHDVYELCSKESLPVCIHVNTTDNAPGFRDEFERVLQNFPKLKVLAPHWMLASRRPSYLRSMLERYNNVWTDTSFGQDQILVDGFKRISINNKIITKLIEDYPDRVLSGSDIVSTTAPHKTIKWMADRMISYQKLLSEEEYSCPVTGEKRKGLSLPYNLLEKVMRNNAQSLLSKRM